MSLVYRRALETDLPQIGKLGFDNWVETYKDIIPAEDLEKLNPEQRTEYYAQYMHKLESGIIVALEDENLLAFAVYGRDPEFENCVYLDSLQTAKDARGRGLGSTLIKMVAKAGMDMGAERMRIGIFVGNDHAGSLYKKLGAEHLDYMIDDKTFKGVPLKAERFMWNDLERLADA